MSVPVRVMAIHRPYRFGPQSPIRLGDIGVVTFILTDRLVSVYWPMRKVTTVEDERDLQVQQ